jgi:glycosyltransferase involved in cell wall biosynthesis
MDLNEVTVIVPTKNESRNIRRFLDGIPSNILLIVVDASDDDTCEIIRERRTENTLIIRDPGDIPAARQRGADVARTEWLLYTDADVVFAEDYFHRLAQLEVTERHGGLVGAKTSSGQYRRYFRGFNLGLRLLCTLRITAGSGSNMLVRRRALHEAGGFDRAVSCNEDSLLLWRISRLGYKVPFVGQLKVYEFDHRRLDGGATSKTLHSVARCAMLYTGILQKTGRTHEWGYWDERRTRDASCAVRKDTSLPYKEF